MVFWQGDYETLSWDIGGTVWAFGALEALIEIEEKEKEELGQAKRKEEEGVEGLKWELRRSSRKLVGWILHLRYGFYTHLSLVSVLI